MARRCCARRLCHYRRVQSQLLLVLRDGLRHIAAHELLRGPWTRLRQAQVVRALRLEDLQVQDGVTDARRTSWALSCARQWGVCAHGSVRRASVTPS